MHFTNKFIDATALQLAAMPDYLGSGISLTLGLIESDFVPDADLKIDDIIICTVPQLSEKAAALGATKLVWDATSGVWGYQLNEPAGGFNWTLTADLAEPKTIYGYSLQNADTSELFATFKFAEPVVFSKVGDHKELSSIIGWLGAPFIGDRIELASA